MKNKAKGLYAALALAAVLVSVMACGSTSTREVSQSAPIVVTATSEPAVATPTVRPRPTRARMSETAYADWAYETAIELSGKFTALGNANTDAQMISGCGTLLVTVRSRLSEAEGITPPARFGDVHYYFTQALRKYSTGLSHCSNGNFSSALIYLNEGNDLIDQATAVLK